MARSILMVTALLLAAALAGCSGGGNADSDDSDDTGAGASGSVSGSSTRSTTRTGTTISASGSAGPVSGNATVGGNATGNNTGNSTGNSTWTYDNRTGTVSGTGVPLVGDDFSEEETFTVANGTRKLVLNLTVDGDDVVLNVQEPDCDDTECGTEVETVDGKASLTFNTPAEGEWVATLTISGTGSISSDYELSIGYLAGNGTADSP